MGEMKCVEKIKIYGVKYLLFGNPSGSPFAFSNRMEAISGRILSGNIGIDLLGVKFMDISTLHILKKVKAVAKMRHTGIVLIVRVVLIMKKQNRRNCGGN